MTAIETPAARAALRLLEFRPFAKGSLVGFAKIEIAPFNMALIDCPVNVSGGRAWAAPPAKVMIDQYREVLMRDGKVRYAQVVEFRSKADRDRFSDAVVQLVRRAHPEVLP